MFDVTGKVALVTGAGSGIGRALAIGFAKEGVKVVVDDINDTTGCETVDLIKQAGGEAVFIKGDVAKASDAEAMVKLAVDTYGRLDFGLNNAGLGAERTLLHDVTEESWDYQLDVDLKGIFLCMKYELAQMVKQGQGGAIVNIASGTSLHGAPMMAPYVASKHGVYGLTKNAGLEYGKQNIRVNAICPGAVNTPALAARQLTDPVAYQTWCNLSPMGKLVQPEEIANLALFLCSDLTATLTASAIVIDGGISAI